MNDAIVFDSHQFVRNLTASGFTERQAEALANEQVQLLNGNLATKTDLASFQTNLEANLTGVKTDLTSVQVNLEAKLAGVKTDLASVQVNLEAKLAGVKADLEVKIANVQANLLKWMFAALIAQTSVVVTLVKLL